ncbi:MAG: ATP-binding protein [Cyanobacteria bacterium P01_A01_bin.135]
MPSLRLGAGAEEELAYRGDDSPFVIGTPISQPRQFFGRHRVVKRLFNLLKTHPLQNAAIIGPRRSGKTSLLNYLCTITTTPASELRPGQKADWLPQPGAYRWVYVDFQDARLAKREGLLRYLLAGLGLAMPEPCDLEGFMARVSGQVTQPTVVLMDEIGEALGTYSELNDEFWNSLRSLATTQTDGNLAFVLATPESPVTLARHTGHSSPFFNIFGYTATLGPLKEDEARELVGRSPIPFAEADVAWMLEQSGGWSILLQILCRERLVALEEGEDGDDWREEGLEQMQPFIHLLQG